MKILMVSMNSIHFQRWTNQFKNTEHDIYWFDIKDGVKVSSLDWVQTFQGWKRKYKGLKGRYFIKKILPKLNNKLENHPAKAFENILLEINPDVVHSFVLYISCTPILDIMEKHKHFKWIYSSWGSDLFYFKNIPEYKTDIIKVLNRVNFLITDCKRDIQLAKDLGFKGSVLGTFPGGGGFDLSSVEDKIKPLNDRNTILIKGYQGRSGRAIEVLKALILIPEEIKKYQIVVFGADKEVETFIEQENLLNGLRIKVLPKSNFLPHEEVLRLMGEALVYIGNSNSDGMPNTLLEAIIMGAFPIQSNPGGATAELINHNTNGLLIKDCEDVIEIKSLISLALSSSKLITEGFKINQKKIKPRLDRHLIKDNILSVFSEI